MKLAEHSYCSGCGVCYAVCPKCGEKFEFTIGESITGGEGWVDGLSDSEKVSAIY